MERVTTVMLNIDRAGIIRAIAEIFKRMNANIESHQVISFDDL
jgi:predicted amino acid-binding ACT domain protein